MKAGGRAAAPQAGAYPFGIMTPARRRPRTGPHIDGMVTQWCFDDPLLGQIRLNWPGPAFPERRGLFCFRQRSGVWKQVLADGAHDKFGTAIR